MYCFEVCIVYSRIRQAAAVTQTDELMRRARNLHDTLFGPPKQSLGQPAQYEVGRFVHPGSMLP